MKAIAARAWVALVAFWKWARTEPPDDGDGIPERMVF
jgi:hypothetical protein